MMDKEIEGRERILVVFKGHNGMEYKIPIYSCVDLEATGKLNCDNISCFGMKELKCDNCIFHEKSVDKDQLKFIVRGLEVISNKDKDQKKEKKTKRYVSFKDDEGDNQILPMLNDTIDGKLSCRNVDCVHHDCINCDKCPLADGWSLDSGEFEILGLELEEIEGGK